MKIKMVVSALLILCAASQLTSAEVFTNDTLTFVDRFSIPRGFKSIPLQVDEVGNAGVIKVEIDMKDARDINAVLSGPQGERVARITGQVGSGEGDVNLSFNLDASAIEEAFGQWELRLIARSAELRGIVELSRFALSFGDSVDTLQVTNLTLPPGDPRVSIQGDGTLPFGRIQGDGTLPFGRIQGDGTLPFGRIQGDGTLPFGRIQGDGTLPFGRIQGDGTLPFGRIQGDGTLPFGRIQGDGTLPFGRIQGDGTLPFGRIQKDSRPSEENDGTLPF